MGRLGRNLSSNLAPFFRVPHCGGDKGAPLLSDTWISLFGGDGGGRNQASRGGGPWRLIGNGPPVNVNGNQGFVQPWLTLYTNPSAQDKLSLAVTLLAPFLHPLHLCWKGRKNWHKRGRKSCCATETEYQRRTKKTRFQTEGWRLVLDQSVLWQCRWNVSFLNRELMSCTHVRGMQTLDLWISKVRLPFSVSVSCVCRGIYWGADALSPAWRRSHLTKGSKAPEEDGAKPILCERVRFLMIQSFSHCCCWCWSLLPIWLSGYLSYADFI